MYPEGGIRTPAPPQLASFKSGPFRVAIEKQVPVVPVTIPDNWFILPNDKKLLMRPCRPRLIFHPPIPTQGMTEDDVEPLKQQARQIIAQELAKHYPCRVESPEPVTSEAEHPRSDQVPRQ